MVDYPPDRNPMQSNQLVSRRPVSESLVQRLSGNVNLLIDQGYHPVMFKANGPYRAASLLNRVDGFYRWRFRAMIINVTLFNGDVGTSGTTEIDILRFTAPGGVGTSIFSTKPSCSSGAGQNAWIGVGETQAGMVAPVLTSLPLIVDAGDVLQLKLLSVMLGNPRDLQVQIDYLPTT